MTEENTVTAQPVAAPPPHVAAISGAFQPVERYLPDDEIPDLKARAARESGGDDAVIVATIDELDRQFALRMPSPSEYTAYFDAACDPDDTDATARAAIQWTIWPSRSALTAARKDMYLLPNRLVDYVERAVGGQPKPEVTVLSENTDADTLREHGIPEDVAASLLKQYPAKGALRIVRVTVSPEDADAEETETISYVLRPLGPATQQLIKGWRTKAKYTAVRSAMNTAMAWPAGQAKDDLFRRYFGIVGVAAFGVMTEQGGTTSRITAKKV